ncbi:hypothetical protein EA658_16520 [Pseudoxanthomonas winnipegensis]|uniref:Uncharacterized protein n=1 Tax=Pseudoxanthomonas winnipegensis TaxID=2480810 RepID=A0ABY1WCI2_9GAMM|nr:hypothetical protein [Pseudoxanthomonas winnipegensis]TAA11267.1 hypothetical protein EA659_07935 [Pseudoxanthomonas winnipegensis]TAA18690.1 hypothetical protein EA658_16520 [Pseudoxanthomonas winnipegensis]TAH73934.1 hypothetical protein EA657_00225 [Pseudoxanthomonas winnipegensis]
MTKGAEDIAALRRMVSLLQVSSTVRPTGAEVTSPDSGHLDAPLLGAPSHDLGLQVSLLHSQLIRYFAGGERPRPEPAIRVAILLRRRREYGLEVEFLAAYIRHFGKGPGPAEVLLRDRVNKAGAIYAKAQNRQLRKAFKKNEPVSEDYPKIQNSSLDSDLGQQVRDAISAASNVTSIVRIDGRVYSVERVDGKLSMRQLKPRR